MTSFFYTDEMEAKNVYDPYTLISYYGTTTENVCASHKLDMPSCPLLYTQQDFHKQKSHCLMAKLKIDKFLGLQMEMQLIPDLKIF